MDTKQIFLILFCTNLFLISFTSSHNKTLRIIGGRDALPGEFPYVMKLEMKIYGIVNYYHVCTCSLLKPTWSLTAAHCIIFLRDLLPDIKVLIRHNLSSDQESSFSNVLSMFTGPNFSSRTYKLKNDIGLLLSEKVPVSSFVKLSSVDYLTLYGSEVLSLGYGGTIGPHGSYGDAHSVNKPLQVLQAIIIKCLSDSTSPAYCLAGVCSQWPASRPGDSGGPVVHVSGIVGVCSSSDTVGAIKFRPEVNSARENVAMFTPVSVYIDWITNVINSNSP